MKPMDGVEVKELKVHQDNRGWLFEVLRKEWIKDSREKDFGQLLLTTSYPGQVKGNHYHNRKIEWFCVLKGKMDMVLKDLETNEVKEVVMDGDKPVIVRIPPKVAHGYRSTGKDICFLLVYCNESFDTNDPDTIPYDVVKA